MVEPTRKGQDNSPLTRGAIVAVALIILGLLSLLILAQHYESHWLVRTVRVVWDLLVYVFVLGWLTVGAGNFFRNRMRERRERAERNEGLNGPQDQR